MRRLKPTLVLTIMLALTIPNSNLVPVRAFVASKGGGLATLPSQKISLVRSSGSPVADAKPLIEKTFNLKDFSREIEPNETNGRRAIHIPLSSVKQSLHRLKASNVKMAKLNTKIKRPSAKIKLEDKKSKKSLSTCACEASATSKSTTLSLDGGGWFDCVGACMEQIGHDYAVVWFGCSLACTGGIIPACSACLGAMAGSAIGCGIGCLFAP